MKMIRWLVLSSLLACVAGTLGAAEASVKKAITHEDVWLMKRLGNPAPSPDGKWVIYAVTDPAYDAKEQWTDLWIKSLTDDTPARRLTYSKGGESGANWSPDSQKVVFSAKRDGDEVAQLYVLNVTAGGEAERITNLSQGARAPKWSPDGKLVLFASDTFPGANDEDAIKKAAKERKERKYNARAYEQFPARFWDSWLTDKRTALFVQEVKAGAAAKNLFAESKIAASAGFGGSSENFTSEWAPDSKSVVIAVALNRDHSAFANVNTQLLQASVEGGEFVRLTNDAHSYGNLAFSPDGKWLLCVTSEETPGEVYDLSRLAAFPWPFKNERKVLTAALDRSVSGYATPENSDRIYFTYEHAGLEKLYSIAYSGGEVRAEKSPETGVLGGLAAGGSALVATWDSTVEPMEIYSLNGAPKRLTSINTEKAKQIDWLPVEHFDFKAANGQMVHNMIVKPAGFDAAKKYPLFTVIHGGAAAMWRDSFVLRWNYHLLAQPGYVLLLTDYKGSTGYGEAFARSIKLDPLKGPADQVNQAVDEAVKRYSFIDGSKLAAGGASYGGHLANWLQATTTRYKAIISHAGEADLIMQWGTSDSIFGREVNAGSPIWGDSPVWREQSPALQAGNHANGTGFKTPILITVGEIDYRVPANNAYMWFALNQRLQVPSKFLIFPEENHWILKGENSRYWYGEVRGWLEKYVK
ncbi:prolyl oligopeptidase family serine peptidase [Oleiharenicola lentus]|uniref:prolyl oligopeptidase family serine peptidase n=1 Tax=Oleiharenicola lentus TaxID=2508720 RepID=UPI003F67B844